MWINDSWLLMCGASVRMGAEQGLERQGCRNAGTDLLGEIGVVGVGDDGLTVKLIVLPTAGVPPPIRRLQHTHPVHLPVRVLPLCVCARACARVSGCPPPPRGVRGCALG